MQRWLFRCRAPVKQTCRRPPDRPRPGAGRPAAPLGRAMSKRPSRPTRARGRSTGWFPVTPSRCSRPLMPSCPDWAAISSAIPAEARNRTPVRSRMRCRGVVAMAWARKVLACGAVWMSSSPRIATSMAWVPIGRALIAKPSLSTSSGMGACSFDRANRTSCPDGLDRLTRTSSSRKVIQPGQAAARGEPAARHDRPLALKLPAWVSSSPPSRSKNIAVEEQGTTGPARALRAVFGAGNLCRHGHVRPSSRTGRRLRTGPECEGRRRARRAVHR